jgi:hypothetical protein
VTPEERIANVTRVRREVEATGRAWKITDEAVLAPIVEAIESTIPKPAPRRRRRRSR